jgi:hypothetical protein
MPQTLRPCPVRAEQFTWDPADRMFTAEASDLGLRGFDRVYPDACDEGLTLISRYAGRPEVIFVVQHEERRDGDTLWWDLAAADTPPGGFPQFTVRIFND